MRKTKPSEPKKDLGYYLRVYRAKHDISQAGLAKRLGVTPSHMSLIESGSRGPSRELMAEIRELVGVPIHALLGVDEEPKR